MSRFYCAPSGKILSSRSYPVFALSISLSFFLFSILALPSDAYAQTDSKGVVPADLNMQSNGTTTSSFGGDYIPANGSVFVVQSIPIGGLAVFNNQQLGSKGFCFDYNAYSPSVNDPYTVVSPSNTGISSSKRNQISAVLRALEDPSYNNMNPVELEAEILEAIWSFANGRGTSGVGTEIRNKVLNGTYQPQPVVWMAPPAYQGKQPLVILPGHNPIDCNSDQYAKDTFSSASYSNQDGSVNWAGNWNESDPNGSGASGGAIRVSNQALRLSDYPDTGTTPSIYRSLDLSSATGAVLSFDISTSGTLDPSDEAALWVSTPSTGYVKLDAWTDDASGSRSYDLTPYLSGDTRIKFQVEQNIGVSDEYFAVDNVKVCISGQDLVVDWGDAPDNYGTTSGMNGPSHVITEGLSMGITPDADPDGNPSSDANGDDGSATADEDGIPNKPIITNVPGEDFDLVVNVVNTTTSIAHLACWIDLDINGSFDDDERVGSVIGSNFTGAVTLDYTNPDDVTSGVSFIRCRLAFDENQILSPNGPATSGEIEDCNVDISASLPVELSSFDAQKEADQAVLLTWTTLTEQDNAGFGVEYSWNGGDFQEAAFIEGAGTTETAQSYQYALYDLAPGVYQFRLKQIDFNGVFSYTQHIELRLDLPGTFQLEPAYPNPFNPTTHIQFTLAEREAVRLALYDVSGRLMQVAFEGTPSAGETQTVRIDASGLTSGVYLIRLEGKGITGTQKITLMK